MSVGRAGPVGCPYNSLHGWVVIEFSVISHGVRLLYLPLSGRLLSHSCEWIKLTGGKTEPCGAPAVQTSPASAMPTEAAQETRARSAVTHLPDARVFLIKDYKTKTSTPNVMKFCRCFPADWGSHFRNHQSLLPHAQFIKWIAITLIWTQLLEHSFMPLFKRIKGFLNDNSWTWIKSENKGMKDFQSSWNAQWKIN